MGMSFQEAAKKAKETGTKFRQKSWGNQYVVWKAGLIYSCQSDTPIKEHAYVVHLRSEDDWEVGEELVVGQTKPGQKWKLAYANRTKDDVYMTVEGNKYIELTGNSVNGRLWSYSSQDKSPIELVDN
jgi:hypothetical protein